MSSDKFDYDFRAVNLTDYELDLVLKANNKLFKKMLPAAKKRLEKKGVSFEEKEVKEFDVPTTYFNVLKTACNKLVISVNNEIKKDFINIVNHRVKNAHFKQNKNNDNWKIFITLEGTYLDKR